MSRMESNVGELLHCEDQLKTTLHFDDKEKLRRKLALLQREYLRTAQRLQRAERSEAVRRHVRSRVTQQNHRDQRDTEVTSNPRHNPSSVTQNTADGTGAGEPLCQEQTGGPAVSENSRKSQGIRFLLPNDAACPQTPDSSRETARYHKSSPALRLRSRRSRLLLERRSAAESSRSTDNSGEGGDQSETLETPRTEGGEEGLKTAGAEFVNESEELFSGIDSESPSMLLTHWNTSGETEGGNLDGRETRGRQEQNKKVSKSTSLLRKCLNSVMHTDKKNQHAKQNARKVVIQGGDGCGNNGEQMEQRLSENRDCKKTHQVSAERKKSAINHDNPVEIIDETSKLAQEEQDVKRAGLMDSCTLIEGLLFPAEYYVRTTRRMSSYQIQPDMQAVILSQLNSGQRRRSRGRGRGLNKHTPKNQGSDQNSQTCFSSLMSSPVGSLIESPTAGTPAELNTQSSSEISEQSSADACVSTTVTSARPTRGRRRRGRGRGRPQTPRCSGNLDANPPNSQQALEDLPNASAPISFSPCVRTAEAGKPCLTPGEALAAAVDPESASIHSPASQPSSGGAGSQSGHPEVYPIFLRSNFRTNRSTPTSTATGRWRSLLLASSPAPAPTSLLPLPSLFPSTLLDNLINFDIPQDFHLPDDQFASLKLQKLRGNAVDSGVEHFASPFYNTQSRSNSPCSPATSFPLSLSLTPKIVNSSQPIESEQASTQSKNLENLLIKQSFIEEASDQEKAIEQQSENLKPVGSGLVVGDHFADSSMTDSVVVSASNTHKSSDNPGKSQPNFSDNPAGNPSDNAAVQLEEPQIKESKEKTDSPDLAHHLESKRPTNLQKEEKTIIKTLSFDSPPPKTPDVSSRILSARNQSPVLRHDMRLSAKRTKETPECITSPPRDPRVHTQLLMSPLLASAPCPLVTPNLLSSAAPSSPALPSLGPTPHLDPTALPLSSSPPAPALTLPPPHSPSTQVLSPPDLSPCRSLSSLHLSQPSASPAGQIQAASEPVQRTEPATCQPASSTQEQEHSLRFAHTLKVPAGGRLVDACCLPLASGSLCVAAAGKWAVCLWTQGTDSEWRLTHTWAFKEPVISVFPVPDAVGLMCVTLGQLEIREVRMLSCSSLSQDQLCEGLIQVAMGVSKSRVVTSAHSACASLLQVFTLSDSGSTWSSQPLVSPNVCVEALAPVDGLSDGVIGTDVGGRLFIWNLKTGQLLQRIILTDGLAHTACLKGYSYCGVLFVLLQHQLLGSLEEEERQASVKEEERKKTTLFSLVAVNPLSGKSVLATQLYPPKAWSGRLCDADVYSSSVVGLSQSGCVCVWDFGRRASSRMVWAPESEGWQLARWGGGGTLVTGHHNGDITLHC